MIDTAALGGSVYNKTKYVIEEHSVDAVIVAHGSGRSMYCIRVSATCRDLAFLCNFFPF